MIKITDIKGEEAIEVLADVIEPLTAIFADKEMLKLANGDGATAIKYISVALKNHKAEVLQIMARLENKPLEEYKKEVNILTLPMQLLTIANDESVKALFNSNVGSTSL